MNKSLPNAIILRNEEVIKSYISQFAINSEPIEVSFRKLVPEITRTDRYTHQIHSYPAKLLVHIPYFFLNNNIFSKEGDYVLDPFCGSGTVILESLIANRNSLGADANPLARLIAEVKVTPLEQAFLLENLRLIINEAQKVESFKSPALEQLKYWFPKKTIEELSKILSVINDLENFQLKQFMLLSFSSCIKKVSYADQRIAVPVKLNPQRYSAGSKDNIRIIERLKSLESIDVFEKFFSVANENIKRINSLVCNSPIKLIAKLISDDARKLTSSIGSNSFLSDESVQLIITSPPYAGAQKYIRASRLNLLWTYLAKNEEIVLLDRKSIGRENFKKADLRIATTGIKEADDLIEEIYKIKPERATIVCAYLLEMIDALDEMKRVLKKGGYLVLIVGNNKVCNLEFNTQEYFTQYLVEKGLELQFKLIDDIKSYGLMTKRNKTADIISREWVLVFKK